MNQTEYEAENSKCFPEKIVAKKDSDCVLKLSIPNRVLVHSHQQSNYRKWRRKHKFFIKCKVIIV